jgi:pSer/pThr/pTyr-binding forkhead associated (FHA) protein
MKRIVVMLDGFIQRDILTDKAEVTIGRNAENDVQIDNAAVSGVHARLTLSPELLVEDLGSTNGTLVGGAKIAKPTPIHLGTPIAIVRYLVYVLDGHKTDTIQGLEHTLKIGGEG